MEITLENQTIDCYPAVKDIAFFLESEWKKIGYQENAFAKIATEALHQFRAYSQINAIDISQWMARTAIYPKQLQENIQTNIFGEPAVTLFSTDRFVIDVYFWRTVDTVIHDHAFNGAFTIVTGETLHNTYQFDKSHACQANDFLTGTLAVKKSEMLKNANTIVTIESGSNLIHSTIHLTPLCVSLCIRTIYDPSVKQYSYTYPSLAISNVQQSKNALSLSPISLLHACHPDHLYPYVKQLVNNKNPSCAAYAIQYYLAHTGDIAGTSNLLKHYHDSYPYFIEALHQAVNYIIEKNPINSLLAQDAETKLYAELIKISKNGKDFIERLQNLTKTKMSDMQISSLLKKLALEGIVQEAYLKMHHFI